ncbi:MAG: class I SAM-dependent methyltransferase [Planctomycetota bacterium]
MTDVRTSEREAWDQFYEDGRYSMVWPSEGVVRFVRRFRGARSAAGKRALDLGCGNGRHLFLLVREGFVASGCDLSPAAVSQANAWLEREGFPACAQTTSGPSLPYEAATFDLGLSYGVLDSMLPEMAERLVAETRRCLKPGAEFFATLRASADRDYMQIGRPLARNTVEVDEVVERGTVQHFFDLSEVRELFGAFELMGLEREDRTDWLGTGRQYCRWEVRVRVPAGV